MHLLLAALAIASSFAGLTEAEVAAALSGKVPVRTETFQRPGGRAAGRGLGAIVVDRPQKDVWATISHFDDKADYMPRIKSVAVLSRTPTLLRVRMDIDASVTTARYTAWFRLDEAAGAISWRLDPGAKDNSIADTDGEYRLFALSPSRTLVVYRSFVDPGRAVPRFIQDYLARRSLPNLLRALKRRVESGGRFRKS